MSRPAADREGPSQGSYWREMLTATLNAAVDGVVLADHEGRIMEVNAATERIFGWPAADLVGERIEKLMPEPYASQHAAYVTRYLEGGEARIIGRGRVVEALRRDGSVFPIELAVGEGRTAEGRFFVGLIRDISVRRELENNLKWRQETLERMFDNGLIATAMTDLDGRFRQLNAAWERILGRSAESLLGETLSSFTHPDGREVLETALRRLSRERAEVTLDDFLCLRADGETRAGSLYLAAVFDDHPEQPDVVVQMVDRSLQLRTERELQEARERLAHLNRIGTLGEMAAGIAHEVNQPLGAIANYAEAGRRVLQQGAEGAARLDEVLKKIGGQARRAGEVIRRLRSLARGDGGGRRPISINEQVLAAVRLAQLDTSASGVRVDLELAEDLPDVVADPVQIQQVLLNLIRNGFDAEREAKRTETGRLPALRVRTRLGDDGIEISVRDRGAGVSAAVAEEIMSPFVTTKGSGMGMGLAICQSIVSAHDGRLWYDANRDGPGTEFSFTLPVEEEAQ